MKRTLAVVGLCVVGGLTIDLVGAYVFCTYIGSDFRR